MTSQTPIKRVMYFGNFDPNFSRNKVYIDGLRQNGVTVHVVADRSAGFRKYWNLFKMHWKLRRDYDVMIVGYTCYIMVPFARLISRKKIIFDALCSFYETEIISRDAYKGNPFRVPFTRTIDWLATRCANVILVETEKQKEYFVRELRVRRSKLVVVYTGLDDSSFYFDPAVPKNPRFTVLFRGRIMIEAGVTHVLRAAKILENSGIDFLVIGYGWDEAMRQFNALLAELKPANLTYIGKLLPIDELRTRMLGCSVSLGQFEDNERLIRTIPHKAFESLAMKIPYVTARAEGVGEIFTDGENCMFVNPAHPQAIADAVVKLRDDSVLAKRLADNAFDMYRRRFTPKKIVEPILEVLAMK